MHCINCSIFFSSFLKHLSFVSPSTKRRLLEWKVWNDITMYVSRGCPDLLISEIENYKPRQDDSKGFEEVIKRVSRVEDDGHACKLVRAMANGEQECGRFEGQEGMVIKGDMWRVLGHMALDSVEAGEPHWVRSCGFEEAWKDIPLREGSKL
jgi:hypothetical protein